MLNETKFQDLYQRHQESALPVLDFCSNEGIAPSTYYYWLKKLKKNSTIRDFIPLLVDPPKPVAPQNYVKSSTPVPGSKKIDDALFELVFPNGTRLRVNQDLDLTQLRNLVCLID